MLSIGDGSQRAPAGGLETSEFMQRLFANVRLPGVEIDCWQPRGYASHAVVYANGCFYQIDCFDARTKRLRTPDELTE